MTHSTFHIPSADHRSTRRRERGFGLLFVLLLAHGANAQESSRPEVPAQPIQTQRWVPLGPAPVDQAGTGSRGYVLPVEDSSVTGTGSNQLSFHGVAANYFYREQTAGFLVTQRYETHTFALDYRRAFRIAHLPRFEVGGHVQLHQSGGGMLNGLIEGIESAWASLTGHPSAKNELRTTPSLLPPQGTLIDRNGASVYEDVGTGAGLGDVYVVAKFALADGDPASRAARVSARAGLNVAHASRFSEGHFFGAGLSLGKKLSEHIAFHGDVRATRLLDDISVWNLPLKDWSYGFSAGTEVRLALNSSLTVQMGGSSTPYQLTGTRGFDTAYGDLTFGLGHRFNTGSRQVIAHFYMRENLNLPFRIRWNTDPDLAIGLKATIR